MPVYRDEKTPWPFLENYDDVEAKEGALENHIYLDAMGFGMGLCCLQITFQAESIAEARSLYDQMAVFCPIMIALSAATPALKGYLLDSDCRWNAICQSVDDRTDEERGLKPLNENKYVIAKSRYDTIDSFLSCHSEKYNDIDLVINEEVYKQLTDDGIDKLLAQHIAHLFIRDPISLFKEKLELDDNQESDHFENIQSTNWQSMRFKPPPVNSPIGWRVEFRPMELQITDFENAAFVTFIVLLSRAIASFKLNFIMPISKVDANFRRAVKRDAVLQERFFFRKPSLLTHREKPTSQNHDHNFKEETSADFVDNVDPTDCFEEMTINEIINGNEHFSGIAAIIKNYLEQMEVDVDTMCTLYQYINLIQRRASGDLKTTACWIRSYIKGHSNYEKDSRISEKINYDLLCSINDITKGLYKPQDLLPNFKTFSKESLPDEVINSEFFLNSKRDERKMNKIYNK